VTLSRTTHPFLREVTSLILQKHSLLKAFCGKMSHDTLVDPLLPRVSFSDTVADLPLRVSRIILMVHDSIFMIQKKQQKNYGQKNCLNILVKLTPEKNKGRRNVQSSDVL